jgi:hypothetical protein
MTPAVASSGSSQPPEIFCNTCLISASDLSPSDPPFIRHYNEPAHAQRFLARVGEILREMVPNRDLGERFDAERMKVLMGVKVVGNRLKEKWKADLFARIEDVFELDVAEKIILDKLYFKLRKGIRSPPSR